MYSKITKFDEFKKSKIKYDNYMQDMRYDKKQWSIKIEKKDNYVEGFRIHVYTYICHFKNRETKKCYDMDLKDDILYALLQISDDTFFLFYGNSFRRISFRDNIISYVHYFGDSGFLYNFFLSEDIFVCIINSFNTFMYSISKNTQIDDAFNYFISSNSEMSDIEIPDSKFAKSRSIVPVYTDDSCYPTYLRINYNLFSRYIKLLVDAKSLKPMFLYDSFSHCYFDPSLIDAFFKKGFFM